MTWQEAVAEFHRAFGVPVAGHPRLLTADRAELRLSLMREELLEWREATEAGDIVAQADALADLIYVTVGTAVESGIPLGPIFAEVHRSNMSKLGEDGTPIHREDGKVLKGPGFTPPAIEPILSAALYDGLPCSRFDAPQRGLRGILRASWDRVYGIACEMHARKYGGLS